MVGGGRQRVVLPPICRCTKAWEMGWMGVMCGFTSFRVILFIQSSKRPKFRILFLIQRLMFSLYWILWIAEKIYFEGKGIFFHFCFFNAFRGFTSVHSRLYFQRMLNYCLIFYKTICYYLSKLKVHSRHINAKSLRVGWVGVGEKRLYYIQSADVQSMGQGCCVLLCFSKFFYQFFTK